MQRTLVFDSLWDNEWEFDSNESPVAPGARALAEEITSRLKKRVPNCDLLRDTLELVRDISGFRWQE